MQRMIGLIVLFGVFLLFIGLNLENKSDVSLGVKVFRDIPVYLTMFLSFGAGFLLAIWVSFKNKSKNTGSGNEDKSARGKKKLDSSLYGID